MDRSVELEENKTIIESLKKYSRAESEAIDHLIEQKRSSIREVIIL